MCAVGSEGTCADVTERLLLLSNSPAPNPKTRVAQASFVLYVTSILSAGSPRTKHHSNNEQKRPRRAPWIWSSVHCPEGTIRSQRGSVSAHSSRTCPAPGAAADTTPGPRKTKTQGPSRAAHLQNTFTSCKAHELGVKLPSGCRSLSAYHPIPITRCMQGGAWA